MSTSRGSGGGGNVQPIPAGSRKVVESLKEIVHRTEAEIYAALKDCNMDPSETVDRLLSQESVPGKSSCKKENVPTPYTTSLTSTPAISGNNRSRGFSDRASAENKGSSFGTADAMQPAVGYQSAWSGAPSQVSMADIVKMGTPRNNTASNAPSAPHPNQIYPEDHDLPTTNDGWPSIENPPAVTNVNSVVPGYTVDTEQYLDAPGVAADSVYRPYEAEEDDEEEEYDYTEHYLETYTEINVGSDSISYEHQTLDLHEVEEIGASLSSITRNLPSEGSNDMGKDTTEPRSPGENHNRDGSTRAEDQDHPEDFVYDGLQSFRSAHFKQSQSSLLIHGLRDPERPTPFFSVFRPLPLDPESTATDLHLPEDSFGPIGYPRMEVIDTSLDGIICICSGSLALDLTLWNPATRFFRRIPRPKIPENIYYQKANVGFAFDSITGDCKIIRLLPHSFKHFMPDVAYIFSVHSGRWEHIVTGRTDYDQHLVPGCMKFTVSKSPSGTTVGGVPYWQCVVPDPGHVELKKMLLFYDLKIAAFSVEPIGWLNDGNSLCLSKIKEHLGAVTWNKDTQTISVWIRDDPDKEHKWSIIYRDLQFPLMGTVIGTYGSGSVVVEGDEENNVLSIVSLEKGTAVIEDTFKMEDSIAGSWRVLNYKESITPIPEIRN
ncbi:hypothetical protein CASFOL_039336 [Castilleja foliolosa]|uniref:F-box associated domain-containing protein n=1 Tax=Castilleja foliolosa TaxID=1961234 RepID=A0ABD3BI64_9LAMI